MRLITWLLILAFIAISSLLPYAFKAPAKASSNAIPIIDIDTGDHAYDIMRRSTYDFSFLERRGIYPGYIRISLDAYETERDGRFLVRLRNGEHTALLPWFPVSGKIEMTTDLMEELDLSYTNFHLTVPESNLDWYGFALKTHPNRSAEREAILDLYFLIDSLNMRPINPPHCHYNKIPSEPDETHCPHKRILNTKDWTRVELGDELDRYMAAIDQAYTTNDGEAVRAVGRLTLGQWMTSQGSLIKLMVSYTHDYDDIDRVGYSHASHSFQVKVNVKSSYRNYQAVFLSNCFTWVRLNGAPPHTIKYTPEQAKIIFGGMMEAMGPLKSMEGVPYTNYYDAVKVIPTNAGLESDYSWGKSAYGGNIPPYCHLIDELEKKAGYEASRDDREFK